MLNERRQKSREDAMGVPRSNSKERGRQGQYSINHEELYRRGSNRAVTHMPEVVTKVTQNSMSFQP